ncbi:MAG: hypothetical protein ACERKD_09155 [Prolixibacteraceae bacterium]
MKTLKLKALYKVNIRMGDRPEIKADNIKGTIRKGQTFITNVEEIENGPEGIAGNSNLKWYKDSNGDFLWSGGFSAEEVKGTESS